MTELKTYDVVMEAVNIPLTRTMQFQAANKADAKKAAQAFIGSDEFYEDDWEWEEVERDWAVYPENITIENITETEKTATV